MNDEIFIILEDYPNYAVSDHGNVFSLKRNIILKPHFNNYGYRAVSLYNKDGLKTFRIGRLVLKTFIKCSDYNVYTCDHINRNRTDDRLENLRWATISEQIENRVVPLQMNTKLGKLNEKYITFNGESYRVRIKNRELKFDKTFHTLEQAIKARDEFIAENF